MYQSQNIFISFELMGTVSIFHLCISSKVPLVGKCFVYLKVNCYHSGYEPHNLLTSHQAFPPPNKVFKIGVYHHPCKPSLMIYTDQSEQSSRPSCQTTSLVFGILMEPCQKRALWMTPGSSTCAPSPWWTIALHLQANCKQWTVNTLRCGAGSHWVDRSRGPPLCKALHHIPQMEEDSKTERIWQEGASKEIHDHGVKQNGEKMRSGLKGRTGLISLHNLHSWDFWKKKKWSDHAEIF